jgi:hypothetical protein
MRSSIAAVTLAHLPAKHAVPVLLRTHNSFAPTTKTQRSSTPTALYATPTRTSIVLSSAPTDFGDFYRGARWRSRENASAPAAVFDAAVSILVNKTAEYAATSSTRFATGLQHNPMIFALVQCTPDLVPSDCRRCLAYILTDAYDQSAFFSGTPLVQLPSASTGGSGRKGTHACIVIQAA